MVKLYQEISKLFIIMSNRNKLENNLFVIYEKVKLKIQSNYHFNHL